MGSHDAMIGHEAPGAALVAAQFPGSEPRRPRPRSAPGSVPRPGTRRPRPRSAAGCSSPGQSPGRRARGPRRDQFLRPGTQDAAPEVRTGIVSWPGTRRPLPRSTPDQSPRSGTQDAAPEVRAGSGLLARNPGRRGRDPRPDQSRARGRPAGRPRPSSGRTPAHGCHPDRAGGTAARSRVRRSARTRAGRRPIRRAPSRPRPRL